MVAMRRSHITGFLIVLSCILILRSNRVEVNASDDYRVHNVDTNLNYTSIQSAINANETLNGHTIIVHSGTYYEHVAISKSLFLLGEDEDNTVIDGNGTSTVVRIIANNAVLANFTIRNGGHSLSWLDSCIYGDHLSNVLVENNTIADATNGVIFYGFSNSTMCNNFVEECGMMGLHLDGNSIECKIINNNVAHCLEGIVLEGSAGNIVEGNSMLHNNASMVFLACTGSNLLRRNNMTSDSYNLIVWGTTLESFIQNVDTSNSVNNKTIYYKTNSNNLLLDPSNCPNLGYVALVNCTDVRVRDADFSFNRDGLLLAQSTNCSLSNLTLSGNHGPLLHGGLTFFKSSSNLISGTKVYNNGAGVCFHQSNGNLFYHNSFVDNDRQVISNLNSPFSAPSGADSTNKWDNDLEGNYWSNYAGVDLDHDGIGDSWHEIDSNNDDRYPLMGMFYSFNTSSGYHVSVISNSTVEDFEYFDSNGTIKIHVSNTTVAQTFGFVRICIPRTLMNDTYHVIIDDAEPYYVNYTLYDNRSHRWIYFNYQHSRLEIIIIPEFPPLLLPLFIVTALPAATVVRRKRNS